MNIKIGTIVNQPGSTFNGKLQEKYNVVVSGWLARNKDGTLVLLIEDNPQLVRINFIKGSNYWTARRAGGFVGGIYINNTLFPDVKWEDDYPTEVKIRIF